MSSSSDEVSSGYDSDLEKIALETSKKIKTSLQKNKKKTTERKRQKESVSCKQKVINVQIQKTSTSKEKETPEFPNFIVDKTPFTLRNDGEPHREPIYDDEFNLSEKCERISEQPDEVIGQNMSNKKLKKKMGSLSSSLQTGIQITDNYLNDKSKKKTRDIYDEIMKKSILTPDFEKQFALTPYEESVRQQKKQRQKEREKTKGSKWYNMEAPEMTEEKKNDLAVIQMRKALDPKRFYKNNDTVAVPKYFQFGTVVESPADFYHSRIPKKQRKSNMVEELLADAEFRKYNKRKYVEIQEQKRKAQGPYKHMKRLKKNKR